MIEIPVLTVVVIALVIWLKVVVFASQDDVPPAPWRPNYAREVSTMACQKCRKLEPTEPALLCGRHITQVTFFGWDPS